VSKAIVAATEINTKAVRKGQTDSSGRYLFSQVNPGTYQVVVESQGFTTAKSDATPVGVSRTLALNFTLHITSATQCVEVTAQQGLFLLRRSYLKTSLPRKLTFATDHKLHEIAKRGGALKNLEDKQTLERGIAMGRVD